MTTKPSNPRPLGNLTDMPSSGDYAWAIRQERAEQRADDIRKRAARVAPRSELDPEARRNKLSRGRAPEVAADSRLPAWALATAWNWGPGTVLTSETWVAPRTIARVEREGVVFTDREHAVVPRLPRDVWEVR